ncbi:putative clathrin assembly protein At1g25240, partial [Hibiscus syriacus]
MSIWKRAAAAIKDKKSLIVAYFSTRSSHRDLDFEAAIIKATSHDEYAIGKSHAQMVFWCIRASPNNICPLIRVLSKRMEKTRSWVVAIKGLMLMHDLIHCKIPAIKNMDGLPFDLSSFGDGHSSLSKTWGFNIFIRQYFAFLDERCGIWLEEENETAKDSPLMVQQLSKLRKLQLLLDMLLKIRPPADKMKVCLILEAMDCVVIEIFDIYGRICSEIAEVLLEVQSVGKLQASMALEILRKVTIQGEELSRYFEFCKEYGVLKANKVVTITAIPEEDFEM